MPIDVDAWNTFAALSLHRLWIVAWQWTILVLTLALPAQWLLRSRAPALRYWLWQIVLLKLLVMPFWSYALPAGWIPEAWAPVLPHAGSLVSPTAPPTVPSETPFIEEGATDDAESSGHGGFVRAEKQPGPSLSWQAWIELCWAGVVLLQIGRLIVQHRRLDRVLGRAEPAGGPLTSAVDETAALLKVPAPRLLTTAENISPFVCGFWRPILVLPGSLTETLSPDQLRQILLHELAHIRRRDLLWGWVPTLVRMVFVFHPVVHWVVYRLGLERELACDQAAIALSEKSAGDYANTLVHVVDHVTHRETLVPVLRWSGATAQAAE